MKNYPSGHKRNGYIDSIIVQEEHRCALCGANGYSVKLDRHEPWGGANRQKSKALGLWVPLCHLGCHEGPGSVHADATLARMFRERAQRAAMDAYGWSVGEFIAVFGKSEIDASINTAREARPVLSQQRPRPPASETRSGFRILDEEPLPY